MVRNHFFVKSDLHWQKLQAWHTWVLICAAGVGVTFCFNIAFTVWASTFGLKNGVATIKQGKCSDIKTWDLWFHLGINVLSTILIGASNYTMQCLSAPVREEIDKGHRERVTFDIGIPSLKNLRRISRIKLILWGLLAVSSIPLHLVYNSVVFSTLSAHSYSVLVVTSDFLSGAPFVGNTTQLQIEVPRTFLSLEIIANYLRKAQVPDSQINRTLNLGMRGYEPKNGLVHEGPFSTWFPSSDRDIFELDPEAVAEIQKIQSDVLQDTSHSEWQNISSKKCREAYRAEIISDRSDVLAVSSANFKVKSLLHYMSGLDPVTVDVQQPWTCTEPYDKSFWPCINSTADQFQPYGYPIDYCLSRTTAEKCQLQFNLQIMIIVMICNLTKAVCMLLTLRHRSATPLLTLGDAVASFLERPDIYTENNCLSDKYNFREQSKVLKRVLHPVLCEPSVWRFFQHSGIKESSIFKDDSLNGEELQDLVAENLPWKNHDLSEHQDWRERVRGFLNSCTFNGQRVQSLIAGKLPLKKRLTSQHSNDASKHDGWSQTIKEWEPKRHFWFSAASPARWLFSLSLSSTAIIVAGVLLKMAYADDRLGDMSIRNLWRIGYGATLAELLIKFHSDNLNSSLAPMLLLANLPQAIISFLYLTYNALFTCMLVAKEWNNFAHKRKTLRVAYPVEKQRSTYWLQLPYRYSIPLLIMSSVLHWLVSQTIFFVRIEMVESKDVITACGYSPIAIITVIPVGVILVLAVVLTGFRRYEKGIPLAGSSSAAISAACHPPDEDVDARLLPVMWGDVDYQDSDLGHCCFTSFAVSTPVEGNLYACVDDNRMQRGFKDVKIQGSVRLEVCMATECSRLFGRDDES